MRSSNSQILPGTTQLWQPTRIPLEGSRYTSKNGDLGQLPMAEDLVDEVECAAVEEVMMVVQEARVEETIPKTVAVAVSCLAEEEVA